MTDLWGTRYDPDAAWRRHPRVLRSARDPAPRAQTEASVRCFVDPDAHRRGDRDSVMQLNLTHGAWRCLAAVKGARERPAAATTAHWPQWCARGI